ncbi:group 1 truncated hemoglobin [Shimazuella sp. AN120528]|uniref:group I truncated hemoglobin n=1 Tax=Shimazuella soli TaxID=1892854 RepID=UPI001F0FDE3F|nr:group 1 truncated hemoglobin [Shimazuella soli]MCH5583626.1 group 1 truncated hemoglobin [Shimazuella soli]
MENKNVFTDLGGEQTIAAIVHEFYHLLVNDKKLAHYFQDANIHQIRVSHITMLVSFLFGGPNRYHGKNMRKIHQGLYITSEEYELAVKHFKNAMRKYNTPIPQMAKVEALLRGVKPHIIMK